MLRSMLLVPADDPYKINKAINAGADAVLIDLEDSVAEAEKANARGVMGQAAISTLPIYVRVNAVHGEFFMDDIDAVLDMECAGIVIPKVESASDMEICNWYLTQMAHKKDRQPGELDLIPIVETAKGIANIREIITACPLISRVSYGAGDLQAETGLAWTRDEMELLPIRMKVVIESAAAGLLPPLDTPHWEFRDMDLLRESAQRGRRLGFGGKMCIHPAQIKVVHEAFSATAKELKWAQQVVKEFEAAEAQGKACITVNGQMVDYAVVKRARNILAIPAMDEPLLSG